MAIRQVVLASYCLLRHSRMRRGSIRTKDQTAKCINAECPTPRLLPRGSFSSSSMKPPNVPPDIIAPERPRASPRQRKAAPPIAILPLDPPEPEPTTPAPAPTAPAESKLAPLCRNVDHRGCNDDAACVELFLAIAACVPPAAAPLRRRGSRRVDGPPGGEPRLFAGIGARR
jgi:hypothetical protein